MEKNTEATGVVSKKRGSIIRSIFMHADRYDKALMMLGFIGSLGDGLNLPATIFIASSFVNDIGQSNFYDLNVFTSKINKNALMYCYMAAATWCFCFLEGYCWTRTAERQATKMRMRYLKAIMRQDVGYFDFHVTCTSEVIIGVSSDCLLIQDTIGEKVPRILTNAASFVGCYILAFVMLWRLAIAGLPFVALLVIPGLMYGRVLMKLARKLKVEYNKAGTIAEQAISSIRMVYAYAGENHTMSAFSDALQSTVKLGLKQGFTKGVAIGCSGVNFIVWSVIYLYGSRFVMYHGAKGGTVFAVGHALAKGGLALGSGLSDLKCFSEATSAGERIMEVINRIPKIDSENNHGLTPENVKGEVEFRNIKFAYPSRPENMIFQDFSLKVPAGETVALVGGSGSGKSTVISLLQRFYDPLGGEILMDGMAIYKIQVKWLRSQMGLVSQEPALFAATIRDNILFGKEDATMEEVVEAARASNAHNFISQLPQGYDTKVGERGVHMSGGQKQRIAIARAIVRKPRILLLDEATSALDSESERVVQEALDKAARGRTIIIVAHRLSTIRHADVIAVIQNGRVMEIGSHDELIQIHDGQYSLLARLQQSRKAKDGSMNDPTESSSSILNHDHHDNISSSPRRPSIDASQPFSADSIGLYNRGTASATTENGIHKREERQKQALVVPYFRRLLGLNLPEWKQASLGCLGAVLYGGIQPAYAFVGGSMMSVLFLTSHDEIKRMAMVYGLCLLGLAVLSLVLGVVQHYSFAYMGEQLTKSLREKMLSRILTFEVGWFDKEENSTGAVCSRLADDANVVRSLVGDRMALLVQAMSAIIIAFTLGLVVAWRLAVVLTAIQPIIIISYYARQVLLRSTSRKAAKSQGESSKLAVEVVSNVRTITAFSSQSLILQMLNRAQQGSRHESVRQRWYAGIGLGVSQSLITLIWGLGLWYGGKLIAQGYITPEAMFKTIFVLISTGRVIADAGSITTDLAKGAGAVGSVFALLDHVSEIEPDDPKGVKPLKVAGQVEFHNVHFCYPARPDASIFRGFSFKIEAGKSTALVGPSGSGKSSIIGLIERFYDPFKGMVLIDGRDIKQYNLRSLRKHIALVSQEPALFAGTIRENIVYGAEGNVGESELTEAAKSANAHDFISGLTDGYNTWVGNGGVQLSGGQKQRIVITRAILKNPSILLLDEATSALDSKSENIVQNALDRVMVGRTSVVVAHRLSTIHNCHLIAVLDKGKVVEKGTSASLLAKGPKGAYYSLVNHQRPPSERASKEY